MREAYKVFMASGMTTFHWAFFAIVLITLVCAAGMLVYTCKLILRGERKQ
jgi:hypothetical protein